MYPQIWEGLPCYSFSEACAATPRLLPCARLSSTSKPGSFLIRHLRSLQGTHRTGQAVVAAQSPRHSRSRHSRATMVAGVATVAGVEAEVVLHGVRANTSLLTP